MKLLIYKIELNRLRSNSESCEVYEGDSGWVFSCSDIVLEEMEEKSWVSKSSMLLWPIPSMTLILGFFRLEGRLLLREFAVAE